MKYIKSILAIVFFSIVSIKGVNAAVCEKVYSADSAFNIAKTGAQLDFSKDGFGYMSPDYITAYYNALNKLKNVTRTNPNFIICADREPNAFAMNLNGAQIVGVSLGMIEATSGDEDVAAVILGHEIAHHNLNHRQRRELASDVLGLIGGVIGLTADIAIYASYGVETSLGRNLSNMGSNLIYSKFSRDHEREADEIGFNYLISAGYNPRGSLKLADKFLAYGHNSSGLFFDSHPGWGERKELFNDLIAEYEQGSNIIKQDKQIATNETRTTSLDTTSLPSTKPKSMSDINWERYKKAVEEYNYKINNKVVYTYTRKWNGQLEPNYNHPKPDIKYYDFDLSATTNYDDWHNNDDTYFDIQAKIDEKKPKKEEANNQPKFNKKLEPIYTASDVDLLHNKMAEAFSKEDFDTVEEISYELEKLNDGVGNLTLAWLFYNGKSVPKDNVKAENYAKKAIALGKYEGYATLSSICWDKNDFKCGYQNSVLGSEKNSDLSIYNQGIYYMYGKYVDKDINKAISLFEKAAALGYRDAHTELSYIYQSEKFNQSKMTYHAKMAAEKFEPRAMATLASWYFHGSYGLGKNLNKSFEYYKYSSEINHPEAVYMMGYFYNLGIVVDRNYDQGKKYVIKSAQLGYQLGIDYCRQNNIPY